jgi:elongation factor 1-gamma
VYGDDPYSAARIDSFLDASLVFARDSQLYLLSMTGGEIDPDVHARAREAFRTYLTGAQRALRPGRAFLVGDGITLADICFVAELALFSSEKAQESALAASGLDRIFHDELRSEFPRALTHYAQLCEHEAFAPDVAPYLLKLNVGGAGLTSR